MPKHASIELASKDISLSVLRFAVEEAMSSPFVVIVEASSPRADVDTGAIVGKPATFVLRSGYQDISDGARSWAGIVRRMQLVKVVAPDEGICTYRLEIVPALWKLSQRRDRRIFQLETVPEIVRRVLAGFAVPNEWRIDAGRYPRLEYRVQYGETDLDFVRRLLEEAGISFFFEHKVPAHSDEDKSDEEPEETAVVIFADEPHTAGPQTKVVFEDNPTEAAQADFISAVELAHEVRPGAWTMRDFDFRKPNFKLNQERQSGAAPESGYTQYEYAPGASLVESQASGGTPVADQRMAARHVDSELARKTGLRLDASRTGRRSVQFTTNVLGLPPGLVFTVQNHPRDELNVALLMTSLRVEGTPAEAWKMHGSAVFVDQAYVPPRVTPRPRIDGVQSAIVVGAAGEEIHTDEFGRVRVQFQWDRLGRDNDESSCWVRVSHGWAGVGYGTLTIPRVGHEVLVAFFEGDPDCPVIIGGMYNSLSPVAFKLPEHKAVSYWRSQSTPGGGGYNEIAFSDIKGDELVHIRAERNLLKLVQACEKEQTLQDRAVEVGKNRTTKIGEVDETTVGKQFDVKVGQSLQTMIDGGVGITNGQVKMTMAGSNLALEAPGEIAIKAGTSVTIESPAIHVRGSASIVIEAGADVTIRVQGGAVTIQGGPFVKINT